MREHQILLMVGGIPMAHENARSIGSTIVSKKIVDPHPWSIDHKHWGIHPIVLPMPFLQEPIRDPSK